MRVGGRRTSGREQRLNHRVRQIANLLKDFNIEPVKSAIGDDLAQGI